MSLSKHINEYYLVFGDGNHWICKFLKKHYRHVFVVWKNSYGWQYLNPCSHTLETKILPAMLQEDVPGLYSKRGFKVYKLIVPAYKKHNGRHGIKLINCVWILKYFLGLSIGGITPYGFLKQLSKADYLTTGIKVIPIMR
jgi:hypothetical protein